MAWYLITLRCRRCGHVWKRRTKNSETADPACPNLACGEHNAPIGMDLSMQKAPAAIGGNIQNKAIDETANIVMQDYGMTDLRTDVREHESAVPKLPPAQQAAADNFFGGPRGGARRMPIPGGPNMATSVAAALSGRLSDPISEQRSIVDIHRRRYRPDTHIVNTRSGT